MENNENNTQNQEIKQEKGLSAQLIIVMLIVVLIIGIGGGFFLGKNISIFNENKTETSNANNIENNTTNQPKTSEKLENTIINEPKTNEKLDDTIIDKTTSNNNNVQSTYDSSKEYAKYYIEKIKELDYVNESTKYGLLYVNQSNIPYLIVDTGWDLSIYKINKDTVMAIKERSSYGTHGRDGYDYIEGTNIMRDYCTSEEGYFYEIYDESFEYKYSVKCTFNGEYRYLDSSIDKIITEEEFNKLSYKNNTYKHLRNVANKNKDEMIKFLEI